MKEILKNSLIIIVFLLCFIFKDSVINLFDKNKKNDISYVLENEIDFYKEQYKILLEQKDIDYFEEYKYYNVKVIGTNIYDFFEKVVTTKPDYNKFKKGDAVINENGFVGVIDVVNKKNIEINLLQNNKTKISVEINGSYGSLEVENKNLLVKNITSDTTINLNDPVYTSGLTTIPGKILVGYVKKVELTDDDLEKILLVRPAVDFENLDYVSIVKIEGS